MNENGHVLKQYIRVLQEERHLNLYRISTRIE